MHEFRRMNTGVLSADMRGVSHQQGETALPGKAVNAEKVFYFLFDCNVLEKTY